MTTEKPDTTTQFKNRYELHSECLWQYNVSPPPRDLFEYVAPEWTSLQ